MRDPEGRSKSTHLRSDSAQPAGIAYIARFQRRYTLRVIPPIPLAQVIKGDRNLSPHNSFDGEVLPIISCVSHSCFNSGVRPTSRRVYAYCRSCDQRGSKAASRHPDLRSNCEVNRHSGRRHTDRAIERDRTPLRPTFTARSIGHPVTCNL